MTCEKCGGNLRSSGDCRLCEMFAAGRPPTISTEATYQAKGALGGAQFSGSIREHYLQAARAAGVSTDGKFYESRIAAFPGDPEAWVSGSDDVRRVVESRGWAMDGDIKVNGMEVEPVRNTPLADDIVEDLVERRLEQEYGEDFKEVSGRAVEVARDEAILAHSPPKSLED